MNKPPKNKSLKSAGKEYGFEAKSGSGTSSESSPSRTSNHYSFKISRWIDKNKNDPVVQKHFPRHDGNGGNAMMYHARKGKMHPLAKHPDFPSDAKAYLQYTKDNLKEDTDLLDEIINKNFTEANDLLEAAVTEIMKTKMNEIKKMIAAKMTEDAESLEEMIGKGKLSKKKKKELSQRIDKKMDDEQVKSLGHKFGGEPFNMDDYNKDTEKLVRNKKYMRMSAMKSKLDYPEYFKEEDADLEEQKMTPCGKVKSSTGEKMDQTVMKQRRGVVEEEKEEKDKPNRANLPTFNRKIKGPLHKPSDADVRRRLEKEIEDAQRREDEEMR